MRPAAIVASAAALALSACAAHDPYRRLARELSAPLKSTQRRVAVAAFNRVDGRPSPSGLIVAEKLITEMHRAGKVVLVERALLSKVADELKLERSGAVDAKTAKKIGELVGAEAIVSGSLMDDNVGNTEINARIIEVSSGRILAASSALVELPVSAADGPRPSYAAPWQRLDGVSGAEPRPGLPETPAPIVAEQDAGIPATGEWPLSGSIGKTLYVFGGYGPAGPFGTFHSYDSGTKAWKPARAPETRRSHAAGGVIDGKFYVAGGCLRGDCGSGVTRKLEIYDPKTDRWIAGPDMLSARASAAGVVAAGKLYVIGGNSACPPCETNFSAVEEFDPKTNRWRARAPMPTARETVAAAAIGSKIFVAGGFSRAGKPRDTNALEVYDVEADKWEKRKPLPSARYMFSAAAVDGKLYVFGGYSEAGAETLRIVDIYDPASDRWTSSAPMPWARHGMSISAYDGRLHLFGGTMGAKIGKIVRSGMDVYDPASRDWTSASASP
ncbi:MAG: hypothetical protein HY078_08150 [Elusimicrobia bacterium]|nr:hypothetical protein [Elusimicrobiota bacterium]